MNTEDQLNSRNKPNLLLDKNGNPVVNQFGHAVSARLTDEQKADIDRLKASGKTDKAIKAELGITQARLKTHLNAKGVAERTALLAMTTTLTQNAERQNALMSDLLDVVAKMESRLSAVQTEVKALQLSCNRMKIGREKAEKERRSQRKELKRLKDILHKRTGQQY